MLVVIIFDDIRRFVVLFGGNHYVLVSLFASSLQTILASNEYNRKQNDEKEDQEYEKAQHYCQTNVELRVIGVIPCDQ